MAVNTDMNATQTSRGGLTYAPRCVLRRLALTLASVAFLSNCAAFNDPNGFFAETNMFADKTPYADYAMAALARNDIPAAEAYVDRAMQRNPKDPYALLTAGIIYQNTGRPQRARTMYQEVMALNPPLKANVTSWSRLSPQLMTDVAANNLQVLEMGQGNAGWPSTSSSGLAPQSASVAPGPMPSAPTPLHNQSMAPQMDANAPAMQADNATSVAAGMETPGDRNAVQRFETLHRLLDEGLITEEEFNGRRLANVGALTPLTSPPPGAGLDRPVPDAEQIIGRIGAIRRALEMRAISPGEHAAERTMILDALLPSAPQRLALPAVPPGGIMDAAKMVGRLERLRESNLVTSDEAARERDAIESSLRGGSSGSSLRQDPPPHGPGSQRQEGNGESHPRRIPAGRHDDRRAGRARRLLPQPVHRRQGCAGASKEVQKHPRRNELFREQGQPREQRHLLPGDLRPHVRQG